MDPCIIDYSIEMPTRCSFVIEFIIPEFIEGSTCFERHATHHQELQTVFAASGLYTHVVTGRCPVWVGTGLGIVPVIIDQVVTDYLTNNNRHNT